MIRAVCLKGRSGSSCPCAQWGRAASVRLPSGRASSQQRVTCVLRPNRRSQLRPTRLVKKMRGPKEIGRASGREIVCNSLQISVDDIYNKTNKKKKKQNKT